MKLWTSAVVLGALVMSVSGAHAEVTGVTIASRSVVAGGQAFGRTGPYEKLAGTIAFALDPTDPRNARIVDLSSARVGPTDGYISQPTCTSSSR
jgi:hypothetical protein